MTTGSAPSHRVLPGGGSEMATGPRAPQGWPAVAIARAQGTVVLTLGGVVDASGAEWLEHLLVDLVDGQGNQSIAMDLCHVEAVDRAVLALLVSVSGLVLRRGGRLVPRDPSVAVLEGLDRAGLGGAFHVSESGRALNDFRTGPSRRRERPEQTATATNPEEA